MMQRTEPVELAGVEERLMSEVQEKFRSIVLRVQTEKQTHALMSRAEQMIAEHPERCETDEMAAEFTETAGKLKAAAKTLENECEPLVSTLHRLHRRATTLRSDATEPVKKLASALEQRVAAFVRFKEELARKLWEEQQRQIEIARTALEPPPPSENGAPPIEEVIAVQPVVMPPPSKVSGAQVRTTYEVEVVNLPAFLRWVAESTLERSIYVQVNLSELRRLASRLGGEQAPPGVQFKAVKQVVAR